MKHKPPSARLARLVEQRFVVWEFPAGAVGDLTQVAALGFFIWLKYRTHLETQCPYSSIIALLFNTSWLN